MVDQIVKYLATIVEHVGIAIILVGFFISLIQWLITFIKNMEGPDFYQYTQKIRGKLGLYLMLGLEFMIASDIISTAVAPTQENLILVGSLVLIRIAIGYFLGRELKELKELS
ncbi:MAG: hypothetical protein DRQ88_01300 [Epsilonproteobacteria bacterium]|nr:MAG: hypothetical protein DRQ89_05370 [Campylobacterota bacterium]RLA67930.1 MAG: hypothetical protein DRQ88_01300 [Campylobacterota bacterium]